MEIFLETQHLFLFLDIIDVNKVEQICLHNSFGNARLTRNKNEDEVENWTEQDATMLFLLPSYFNHSCVGKVFMGWVEILERDSFVKYLEPSFCNSFSFQPMLIVNTMVTFLPSTLSKIRKKATKLLYVMFHQQKPMQRDKKNSKRFGALDANVTCV